MGVARAQSVKVWIGFFVRGFSSIQSLEGLGLILGLRLGLSFTNYVQLQNCD